MTLETLYGLRVHSSPMVPRFVDVPNRKHIKRRTQRQAYHDRISKKWLKRFGTHKEQHAYVIDARALVMVGNSMIVLHPDHLAQIRQRLDNNVFRR